MSEPARGAVLAATATGAPAGRPGDLQTDVERDQGGARTSPWSWPFADGLPWLRVCCPCPRSGRGATCRCASDGSLSADRVAQAVVGAPQACAPDRFVHRAGCAGVAVRGRLTVHTCRSAIGQLCFQPASVIGIRDQFGCR